MGKKYQRRETNSSNGGVSRNFLPVLLAFFSGYLISTYVDIGQLAAWLNIHTPPSMLVSAPQFAERSVAPKPKLEFYTLLTANNNATGSKITVPPPPPAAPQAQPAVAVVATTTKPNPAPVVATTLATAKVAKPATAPQTQHAPGTYTIQVAAFRAESDADHMKASLIMKGFDANVSAVASRGVTWYRVRVGRFKSHEQAVQAQTQLSQRERVNGMIQKVDV